MATSVNYDSHKLEPEFKKKWIEALRSGEYTQTTRHLRDKNGFCCLGVAEDIMLEATGNTWICPANMADGIHAIGSPLTDIRSESTVSSNLYLCTNLAGMGWIPVHMYEEVLSYVRERCKEKEVNVVFTEPLVSLAFYNDAGLPFPIMADIIEKFY